MDKLKKRTRTIYICSTYYHVYVTLCKVFSKQLDTDILICSDIARGKDLVRLLREDSCVKHAYYFDNQERQNSSFKNRIFRLLFQHRYNRKEVASRLSVNFDLYKDIYIFNDDTVIGRYLADIHHPYHLLEDAQDFFKIIHQTPFARCIPDRGSVKYWLRKLLRYGYFPLGDSKYVIDIEVNDTKGVMVPYSNLIEEKKDELFSSVSRKDQMRILSLLGGDISLQDIQRCSVLVLTQPLYFDGYVDSVQQQKQAYQKILQMYQKNGQKVAVKPHPRDELDYSDFGFSCIIPSQIPSELLNMLPIQFEEAVTISSTAIHQSRFARKKVMLGNQWIDGLKTKE